MNTYEFLLLLTHLGAPAEHIQYAGEHVGHALDAGHITHDHNAAEWLDAVPFECAPDTPSPWVAYAYHLMLMPVAWVEHGIPQGEARTKAIGILYLVIKYEGKAVADDLVIPFEETAVKLYAVIDSRNYAIIGEHGKHEVWVDSDNYEPVTPIYNEQGARDVSLEDIIYAGRELAGWVYSTPEIKTLCENAGQLS